MTQAPFQTLSDQKIIPITVSYGDGDGPEIMEHILTILQQAGARISINSVDIGENFYKREYYNGIPDSAWQTITHHPVIFMAPSQKPEGEEYHDLLQTLCTSLELHTVVAPLSHTPPHHVLIGRNEAAFQKTLGYRLQPHAVEELRIFTDKQTSNLLKHAAAFSCLAQLNDIYTIAYSATSLSASRLQDVAKRFFPDDNHHTFLGSLAQFLVTDAKAGIIVSQENGLLNTLSLMHGSQRRCIGFLGEHYVLFTGVSARASFEGQLHAAILMLVCLNQPDIASRLHHAWLSALSENPALNECDHDSYASTILSMLKENEHTETPTIYQSLPATISFPELPETKEQQLIGIEITLGDIENRDSHSLSQTIEPLCEELPLQLQLISTRGFTVWPKREAYVFGQNDYVMLRFLSNQSPKRTDRKEIATLIQKLEEQGLAICSTRHLSLYDEHVGFSVL